MSKFSIRKIFSHRGSQAPGTTQSAATQHQAPQGKSHFLGGFHGLRSRGSQVASEPTLSPRVDASKLAAHAPAGPAPSTFSFGGHHKAASSPQPAQNTVRATTGFHGASSSEPLSTNVHRPSPAAVPRDASPRESRAPRGPSQASAPAARPVQREAERPAAPRAAVSSEFKELRAGLEDIGARMKVLDLENFKLQTAPEGTPQQEAAIEKRLGVVNEERMNLIAMRKLVQTRLAFIEQPSSNPLVQSLIQLADVKGPAQMGGHLAVAQGEIIRANKAALREQGGLLDQREDLIHAQQQVRKALSSGAFSELPPSEQSQMRKLARLDIGEKLSLVDDLKEMVRQTEGQLRAMGGGGLFDSIPTSPKERAAMRQEALRRDQEAWDNGYRS